MIGVWLQFLIGLLLSLILLVLYYPIVNKIMQLRGEPYSLQFDQANISTKFLDYPRLCYHLITTQFHQNSDQPPQWVVMFHSWGRDSSRMQERAQIYLDHGYAVLLMDAPGHGYSQFIPFLTIQDTPKYAEMILAKEQIENPILHGLSLGAVTAVLLAKDYPSKAVVAEALISDFAEMYAGIFSSFKLPRTLSTLIPKFILTLLPQWNKYQPVKILQEINVPVFLIHGDQDNIFPPELHFIKNLNAMSKLSEHESWLVPNSQHTDMIIHPDYGNRLMNFIIE